MTEATERMRDDLVAYALGALEPSERQRVEVELQSGADPEAARLLSEFAAVRDLLPYGLAPQEASAGARERLLNRARGRPVVDARARTGIWQRLVDLLSPLRWAVVAVALIGAVAWNVQLQQQVQGLQSAASIQRLATQDAGIPLVGTGVTSGAARLYIGSDGQRAELAIIGLPQLSTNRTYQLWFARPGQPTETGGAFRVDDRGQALVGVVIPVPLNEVSAIAVTEEPMPASLRPTGQHLLDGRP